MPRGGKHVPSTVSSNRDSPTPQNNTLLQELYHLIHSVQRERDQGESTLANIAKTHERMKQEVRISPYFKAKLQGLYTTALQEAKSEAQLIEETLDKITAIKQQEAGEKSRASRQHVQPPMSIEDIQTRKTTSTMRRGVLMNILQQSAQDIPIWDGKTGEMPVPLCGCVPAEDKYKAKPGSHVAAHVKTDDGEEQWILAVVNSYNSHSHKYVVDDIDEEGNNGKERHTVMKRKVIPLPLYKVDPHLHPQGLFKLKQPVLALYPQTTCFYKANIHKLPKDVNSDYAVLFEDPAYPDGFSPPLDIPQRFVLPVKESKRR
ncbi:SAGA-associated factor 29-like [Dysidea avara]|uniref:SAGA-associated factor 29-like n=1 Tax=Dysidea avara TaxID=196820 RepID=UPI0033242C5B